MDTKRLFVGSIPPTFSNRSLKQMFTQFGKITEVAIEKHRYTGASKGFGYVTFATSRAAQKAINNMDQKELEGKKMLVTFAKTRK